MREDIRKLDRLDEQTRLLGENRIETLDDLNQFRDAVKAEIDTLLDTRKGLRAQLKTAAGSGNEQEADSLRVQIAEVNTKLKELRHSLKVADRIEERAEHLEEMKAQLTGFSEPEGSEKAGLEGKERRSGNRNRKR